MLGLSLFEPYSRWVPLTELHYTSTAPGLLFVCRLIESLNKPLFSL